jgi:hypothetical protein
VTPEPPAGPSSRQLAGALASNAATKRFNIVGALVAFGVVLAIGAPVVLAAIASMVVYTAAAARTMSDAAETARVTAELESEQQS